MHNTTATKRAWRVVANLGNAHAFEVEDRFLRAEKPHRTNGSLFFGANNKHLAGGIGALMQGSGIGRAVNNLAPGKSLIERRQVTDYQGEETESHPGFDRRKRPGQSGAKCLRPGRPARRRGAVRGEYRPYAG